jgi:excisionase family DNA binding protein
MPLPKLLYSISESREILGVSRTTIWRLICRKKLNPTRIGSRVLFTPEDLKDFVERRRKKQ